MIDIPQNKRDCLLVQFPAGTASDGQNAVQELLQLIGEDCPVAVEFRTDE